MKNLIFLVILIAGAAFAGAKWHMHSKVADSVDMPEYVGVEMRLAGDMVTEFMKGTAYRPRMSDLRIEYVDRSLNECVRKYCMRQGLSDEEILAAQMEAFHFMGEANGIVFDEYMTEPYKDFLAGKPLLVITAKPSEPISLSQLKHYKPTDVPALLDLSAAAM